MALIYPWNNVNDVKFKNGEILNSITFNTHLKKIYDNAVYLNNHVFIGSASTTTTGATTLATSAEVIAGILDNKAVTTSAFNSALSSISQVSNYTTLSSINMTDSIRMIHGEITALSGLSTPYVVKVDYGNNKFSTTLLNFSLFCTAATTAYDSQYLCYRYLDNSYNTTDVALLSSIPMSDGFTNPLSCAYIVYYNKNNKIQTIKWSAIGI